MEDFELGFADRELSRSIPPKRCKTGATLRKRLAEIGIYRETGHGHFNGSLTVPIRNLEGEVCELYGRKIGAHLIKGTRFHSYLPENSRPHGKARGIFNWSRISEADEIILTDSILNALTFYSAGVGHVTCTLGAESTAIEQLLQPLTAEQVEAFQRSPTKRIVLAIARTKQGEAFEADLVEQLTTLDKPLYRVKFPVDEDANDA